MPTRCASSGLSTARRTSVRHPSGAAANYCDDSNNWTSTTTLLQTYPETFRITGMTVNEYHSASALLAGQTPRSGNPYYEDELWHLADVLQHTWLRSATVAGQRFPLSNVDATLGAWGIGSLQTQATNNLADEVALYQAVDLDAVTGFITSNLFQSDPIYGTETTVLIAGEESYRTLNLGSVDQVDINSVPTIVNRTSYTNSVMTVDFTGKPVSTDGMLRWQPYQFDGTVWKSAALGDYLDQMGLRVQFGLHGPHPGGQWFNRCRRPNN